MLLSLFFIYFSSRHFKLNIFYSHTFYLLILYFAVLNPQINLSFVFLILSALELPFGHTFIDSNFRLTLYMRIIETMDNVIFLQRIFYFLLPKKAGILDPIRDWKNWRLFLRLCEGWSITDLAPSSAITLQRSILKD